MPRVNRWMVFPGELRHGMVPVDDDKRPRYVILFNYWSTHQPGPPNCQAPDLSNYRPICAKAPTSKHLLPSEQLLDLRMSEEERQLGSAGGPISLEVEEVEVGDLEWSSNFGELSLCMPVPALKRLRQGPRDAALLHLPWRLLAARFLGTDTTADSDARRKPVGLPLSLVERLLLWEVQHDAQRLQRRASATRAWLESDFVEKAIGLVEKELEKLLEKRNDDTRLGLSSLIKYVRDELKIAPRGTELDGAFFSRNVMRMEAAPCDDDTLQGALLDVVETRIHAWCEERHLRASCRAIADDHHGMLLVVSGLTQTE